MNKDDIILVAIGGLAALIFVPFMFAILWDFGIILLMEIGKLAGYLKTNVLS